MRLFLILAIFSLNASSQDLKAQYKVRPGSLHKKGDVTITVLPDPNHFKVKMDYQVKKKSLVPVPSSLLRGDKIFDFPPAFRTEAGYKELEVKKLMTIPKAVLSFKRRGDIGDYKGAYFLEVLPINKKSKIEIVYHPKIPSVGWKSIKITFLSPYPILDGYELEADFKR